MLRVHDSGQLIGRVGKNFDGNLLRIGFESLIAPLGNEAGELGKLRGSANGLDIPI